MQQTQTTEERAAFLQARRRGIGGSDAPAVLGYGRKSPLELYAIKTGEMEDDDLSDVEHVYWGNRLEEVVISEYERRTGRHVIRGKDVGQLKSAEHPFMFCHSDGLIEPIDDRGRGVLEAKTGAAWKGAEWDDEPPLAYQVQLQHNIAVAGLQWGSLCCLIGGNRFVWIDYARNDRFIQNMIAREAAFWDCVESKTPPPLSQVEADARALAALYPSPDPDLATVALPPEAIEWDERLCEAVKQIKYFESIKKDCQNRLKHAIGNHTVGYFADGTSYSWKEQSRAEHVVKASSFRVLRRHKSKKGR